MQIHSSMIVNQAIEMFGLVNKKKIYGNKNNN